MSQHVISQDETPYPASRRRAGRRRSARLRLPLIAVGVAAIALVGSLIGPGFAAPVPSDGTPIAAATPAAPIAPAPTGELAEVSAPPVPPALPTPLISSTGSEPGAALPAPAHPAEPTPAESAAWLVLNEERFDQRSANWPEIATPSWSSAYRDGRYEIRLLDRPSINYSSPLSAHDFQLRVDVQIERGRAGLFFLIDRPNDFYRFLIDAEGHYQLEVEQVGVARPLIAWTASDALLRGAEAVNQIEVQRAGDELSLYANGALLTIYTLPAGSILESRVGLALDAPDGQREALALFDNLFARGPAVSSTD